MGANNDIREFNFYQNYLWSPNDFSNFQNWVQSEMRASALGRNNKSILAGLLCTPDTGLNVAISDGIAIDSNGRIVVAQSIADAVVAEPVSNPAKTLIVARPKLTDMTNIPTPLNPVVIVPLHEKLDYEIVVLNGVPGVSPVYPTPQANDIVLTGLIIPAGTTTLLASMFDISVANTPKPKRRSVQFVDADYTVLDTDEHVEADATSGLQTNTLPDPAEVPGQDFCFCKSDASANGVKIASTFLISGQSDWTLEDQYATLKVRSIGTTYRVV